MDERLNSIITSIRDSLEKTKTALQNQYVNVESLKVSEIPDYIRQIEQNKYILTVNCSEFENGTITATQENRTRTGTVENGKCNIKIPTTGQWHIEHELGDYIDVEISGTQSVELIKKKVVFSEGDWTEEKIIIHIDSVVGNNKNDNFIRVKKNGVIIEVQAQLVGSDIEITNFEYEEGATYTVEYVIKDEVRGSIEVEIVNESNCTGSLGNLFSGMDDAGVICDFFSSPIYTGIPKNLVFTDKKAPDCTQVFSWSKDGKNGVVRWVDREQDTLFVSTQKTGRKIVLPEDCSKFLYGYDSKPVGVESVDLENVDSSQVKKMSYMFDRVTEIKNLDKLNTENVTDMSYMFNRCNVTDLDLSSLNTENVTDMSYMFNNSPIEKINLSKISFQSVKTIFAMFYYCQSLITVDLSDLILTDDMKFNDLFFYCRKLTTIYAPEWAKLGLQSDDINMFEMCSNLPNFNYNTDISMAKWKENGGYFTNPTEKPS